MEKKPSREDTPATLGHSFTKERETGRRGPKKISWHQSAWSRVDLTTILWIIVV